MTAVEYLEESGVPESRWPNFRAWFNWFDQRGLVGVVRKNGSDEVVGVALARCLPSGAEPAHYTHEESGDDVFVDLTVCGGSSDSTHTGGRKDYLKSLLVILFDRFGRRRTLTFNRNGNRKAYDYDTFMRKALS